MNIDQGKREWTSEELDGLREAVEDAQKKGGLSAAEVARRSGVAPATLSQFMSGKYAGSNANVARDLSKWLDAHHRETQFRLVAPPEPRFVQTQTSLRVHTALQHAQLLGDTAVVVGPPGAGKTASLDQYATATPRVLVVTASPAVSTASAVLASIINRYSPQHSRTERALAARSSVVRALLGPGSLLVVDEGQHLAIAALEELRAIHDDRRCGLAIIGNATVLSRIQGGSRDPAYAQLFGRVGHRVVLTKGTDADVQAVLETMDVTAPDVLKVAVDIAKREDLRVVVKVTRSALLIANGARENLEPKHMRAAHRQLTGDGRMAA